MKTRVYPITKKFTPEMYDQLLPTESIAIIGSRYKVVEYAKTLNEGWRLGADFGAYGKDDYGVSVEESQNPRGSKVKIDRNLIALGIEACRVASNDFHCKLEEVAAFCIVHGAGHNAGLNHSGSTNDYDEVGNYKRGIRVPEGENIMADLSKRKVNERLVSKAITIDSLINVRHTESQKSFEFLDILSAYKNKFGVSPSKPQF